MGNESLSSYQRALKSFRAVPGVALLFALIPLVVFGYLGWYYYAADKIDKSLYSIAPSQIQISTQPAWIKSSVLESVYKEKRLDKVNLLDPTACAHIASAFETSAWVKSTTRVRKLGGQVIVDLVYRQPLAMLRVVYQDRETNKWVEGYYPLDVHGHVLPKSDFAESEVPDFLLIDIENVGLPSNGIYADGRVHHALKLCAFLESTNKRQQLGVQWVNVQRDDAVSSRKQWSLQLRTTDQRLIVWGHCPEDEIPGESKAAEKLATLEKWLNSEREKGTQGGTLDLMLNSNPTRTAGH